MSEGRTLTQSALLPLGPWTRGLVRVVSGPGQGASCAVGSTPIVVGSSGDAALRLDDAHVSRRHCSISLGPFGFLVKDEGSRNGTFFGASKVGELAVPSGALLRVGRAMLALEATDGRVSSEPSAPPLPGLVGHGAAMRRLLRTLQACAATDATVLLMGETGTGKGLAARSLHQASARRAKPFEVLDCGGVAPTLIQSELFGHAPGAFTGATRTHPGVFQRGHGGTVFLDEIGELPLDVQATLLRVTETREVMPLGATAPLTVDVRLVAATHRDLASGVSEGWFREDLYYRLNVMKVELPPLRERLDDLPVLCDVLLRGLGLAEPGPIQGPNLERLARHAWPGNVRELRNVLERALVTSRADSFAGLVPSFEVVEASEAGASFQERKQATVAAFEKKFLSELLQRNAGNIKQSSRESGIERTQLKRLLKKHGLL